MGMFDYYEPQPPIQCESCGRIVKEWQGKDGPNALFVWRQGFAAPVEQKVDEECKLSPQELAKWRLPPQFSIMPVGVNCRNCAREGIGRVENGVWTALEII